MTIYPDKELRLIINEMIETHKISVNLCYLCLAHLIEKINHSNHNYKDLIPNRDAFAKVLVENGVDKDTIIQNVKTIYLKKDYPPNLTQVKKVTAIILANDYSFVEEMISEKYIIRKSIEQTEIDSNRLKRSDIIKNDNKKIQEIVDYILETFSSFTIDSINVDRIRKIKTNIYSYDLVLETIKVNTKVLTKIVNEKMTNVNDKFAYFIKVIENLIPQHYMHYKQKNDISDEIWRQNAYSVYLGEETLKDKVTFLCNTEYYVGKDDFVTTKLKNALIELHNSEVYRNVCKEEHEKWEIFNRSMPEYKTKLKENKSRFDDLW